MSWMQRLYQTYEQAKGMELEGEHELTPIGHTPQQAHINVVLDGNGNFLSASVQKRQILLQCTEASEGRTGQDAPHGLSDKLQYLAGDYKNFLAYEVKPDGTERFAKGVPQPFFESYLEQLTKWCEFGAPPKVHAVLAYVQKKQLIQDLVVHKVLFKDEQGYLLDDWVSDSQEKPEIFKLLLKSEQKKYSQGAALVCWSVNIVSENVADTWLDKRIQESWAGFLSTMGESQGFCHISGKQAAVTFLHPAKLRHTGDKAKLISANDKEGLTFKGRFIDNTEAASISADVSQKAHSALRWLIARQGARNGDQVTVAWAVSGKEVPSPVADAWDVVKDDDEDELLEIVDVESSVEEESAENLSIDLGEKMALRLKKKLKGYRQTLSDTEQLSIMSLDSATPGRMAISYYREAMSKEYLDALEDWYEHFAWYQRHTKEAKEQANTSAGKKKKPKTLVLWPILAPASYAIAQAAYGSTLSDTLKKQLYARVLPCIVDRQAFPVDILQLCINRASNPQGSEPWEWLRNLGVVCALYRGYFSRHPDSNLRRIFTMELDESNQSRSYLYGRLLAIAEQVEDVALRIAKERRPTRAMTLMMRFSQSPFVTWKTLSDAIIPYQLRLRSKYPPLEAAYKDLMGLVMTKFKAGSDGYDSSAPLDGEYLMGYHLQRMWLRTHQLKKGEWVLRAVNEQKKSEDDVVEIDQEQGE